MRKKTLKAISDKIRALQFHESFDLVIGIARGGIIPAYLVSSYYQIPFDLIWINYRNESHIPQAKTPRLLKPVSLFFSGKKILLIDDRVKTGTTLVFAKRLLKEAWSIKTLSVNGCADYSLYNEDCFGFPWSDNNKKVYQEKVFTKLFRTDNIKEKELDLIKKMIA